MIPARRLAEEVGLAFSLLTRLPVPRFELRTEATLATAFWAYPVAGAIVSLVPAFVLWIAWAATGQSALAAVLALAAGFLATGGFHEDGLADFWDGIGGGADPARRLEIMRDSRLGTYGALALFVALAAKVFAVAGLVDGQGLSMATAAIVGCGCLARGAIALPFAALPPSRDGGLAAQAKRPPVGSLAGGVVISLVLAFVLLGPAALAATTGALVGAAGVALLAHRFLGGYTGDVLGASALTGEVAALVALGIWT